MRRRPRADVSAHSTQPPQGGLPRGFAVVVQVVVTPQVASGQVPRKTGARGCSGSRVCGRATLAHRHTPAQHPCALVAARDWMVQLLRRSSRLTEDCSARESIEQCDPRMRFDEQPRNADPRGPRLHEHWPRSDDDGERPAFDAGECGTVDAARTRRYDGRGPPVAAWCATRRSDRCPPAGCADASAAPRGTRAATAPSTPVTTSLTLLVDCCAPPSLSLYRTASAHRAIQNWNRWTARAVRG